MSKELHGQGMLASAPIGISGHWRRTSSSWEESERITVVSTEQPSVEKRAVSMGLELHVDIL